MKNKIIIVIITFLIIVTGCGVKEDTPEYVKSVMENEKIYFRNTIVCDAIDGRELIVFPYSSKYFATNDKVYRFSMKKIFSNDQNCIEVEIDSLDSDIMSFDVSGYLVTKTGVYEYSEKDNKFVLRDWHISNYKYLEKDFDGDIMFNYRSNYSQDGIVVIDGKIVKLYKVNDIYDENHNYSTSISYNDVEVSFADDETVVGLYGDLIKTNKAYYQVKRNKLNKEECDKYEDVKCIYSYKLALNKFYTENYKYIKYIDGNGGNIIDIYNNRYEAFP